MLYKNEKIHMSLIKTNYIQVKHRQSSLLHTKISNRNKITTIKYTLTLIYTHCPEITEY